MNVLRKLVPTLVGLGLGLGLCELAARLIIPTDAALRYNLARRRENDLMRGRFYAYDPALGWKLRAGASGRFDAPDFSSTVNVDEHGHRRMPPRASSEPPSDRVLVVGDSVAFGYGVNDDETFSAQLAKLRPDLEVVNLAVSGYGTDQELLLLRQVLKGLDARTPATTVVVTFYLNDLLDNMRKSRSGYAKPYFVLSRDGDRDRLTLAGEPVPPPAPRGGSGAIDDELSAHLRSYALIRPRITNLAIKLGLLSAEDGVDDYLGFFVKKTAPERAPGWTMWRALMTQMDAEVEAAGATLVILVMPVRTQVVATARARLEKLYGYEEDALALDEPEAEIARFGREHGVRVVELLGDMRAAVTPGVSPYFAFDLHPDALGHRVIAAALARAIPRLGTSRTAP